MKCISCGGSGDWGDHEPEDQEDPGVTACDECDGTGRVSFARWAWWTTQIHAGSVAEWLAYTAMGRWWWTMARERRAASCADDSGSKFAAMARHGRRLEQLAEMTAMTEDFGGPGLDRIIERQRRLCWEARRAVELFGDKRSDNGL